MAGAPIVLQSLSVFCCRYEETRKRKEFKVGDAQKLEDLHGYLGVVVTRDAKDFALRPKAEA